MASGTGNLPYPGKSYTPFDILTAEELNEDVANIESLADGTGIGDGAVTTAKIGNEQVTAAKLDFTSLPFGDYKEIEVNTGFKWIDGKPIYRKTFSLTVTANVGADVAHGITGLTRVIKWENSFFRSDIGVTFPHLNLPSVESVSPAYLINLSASSTNLQIPGGSMPYNGTAYITLYYIK